VCRVDIKFVPQHRQRCLGLNPKNPRTSLCSLYIGRMSTLNYHDYFLCRGSVPKVEVLRRVVATMRNEIIRYSKIIPSEKLVDEDTVSWSIMGNVKQWARAQGGSEIARFRVTTVGTRRCSMTVIFWSWRCSGMPRVRMAWFWGLICHTIITPSCWLPYRPHRLLGMPPKWLHSPAHLPPDRGHLAPALHEASFKARSMNS